MSPVSRITWHDTAAAAAADYDDDGNDRDEDERSGIVQPQVSDSRPSRVSFSIWALPGPTYPYRAGTSETLSARIVSGCARFCESDGIDAVCICMMCLQQKQWPRDDLLVSMVTDVTSLGNRYAKEMSEVRLLEKGFQVSVPLTLRGWSVTHSRLEGEHFSCFMFFNVHSFFTHLSARCFIFVAARHTVRPWQWLMLLSASRR